MKIDRDINNINPNEPAFVFKKLDIIKDERGFLVELLKNNDEIFNQFGQVYITCCTPGYVKAWHYHRVKTDYFTCINGTARVAIYDNREGSSTKGILKEYIININNPILVKIPPGCYHGFEAIGEKDAHIISITSEPYDPDDTDEYRIAFDDRLIPFKWIGNRGY